MTRLALLLALPLVACGDDVAATITDGSSSGSTSTGSSTTADPPTTSEGSTGTSTTSTASGSDSEATSTSTSSTGDTTEGVVSSSSTSEDSTTGTTTGTTTSTTTSTTGTSTTDDTSTSTTTGTTGDTTTGGELEQPVPAGMCFTNDLTTFVEPIPQAEELHIVSVYQPNAGAITVDIARAGVPLTLVLSSYEPVQFNLVLAPGVQLEHVVLNGYNVHGVQGHGQAMVTDMSGVPDYIVACGYFWPEKNDGCDTPGLVAGAETLTGLTLTSFVGCYEGSSFSLE